MVKGNKDLTRKCVVILSALFCQLLPEVYYVTVYSVVVCTYNIPGKKELVVHDVERDSP